MSAYRTLGEVEQVPEVEEKSPMEIEWERRQAIKLRKKRIASVVLVTFLEGCALAVAAAAAPSMGKGVFVETLVAWLVLHLCLLALAVVVWAVDVVLSP